MAAQQFEVGEFVDITIRGAQVVNTYTVSRPGTPTGTVLVYKMPDETDRDNCHTAPVSYEGVTVERVTPAQWPPQPGDLWRDSDGDLWAWRQYSYPEHGERTTLEDFVSLTGKHTASYGDHLDDAAGVQGAFGPLTLVRREMEGPF